MLGAQLFFYSRVAHAILYILGVPLVRPLAWAVGIAKACTDDELDEFYSLNTAAAVRDAINAETDARAKKAA